MTKNGIVHLAFHPGTDTLILAAADKSGHIGLWSVHNDAAGPSAADSKENEGQANGQDSDEGHSVVGDKTGGHHSCAPLQTVFNRSTLYSAAAERSCGIRARCSCCMVSKPDLWSQLMYCLPSAQTGSQAVRQLRADAHHLLL